MFCLNHFRSKGLIPTVERQPKVRTVPNPNSLIRTQPCSTLRSTLVFLETKILCAVSC